MKKLIALYRVEFRRLLLSKMVWAAALLSFGAPLAGYAVTVYNSGMSDIYIKEPVMWGTPFMAVVWAVVTMMEASRLHRSNTNILTDAAASPRTLSAARIFALLTLTAVLTVLCACLYLPYTAWKMEYLFQTAFYFANFLIFMMPTVWISILFAEGIYQVTRRLELSLILYAMLAYISLGSYAKTDYFLRWLNPFVITYSDGFVSWWPLRMGGYTRLLWLCFAAAVWVCGLLCVRKYEKNLVISFVKGMKKGYLPVLAVCFCLSGAALWICQPFINHEPKEFTDENSSIETPQMQADAIRYAIKAKPLSGRIAATAEFDLQKPYAGENKLLLQTGYKISRMTYGGQDIAFHTKKDDLNGVRTTYFTLPGEPGKTLVIEYGGIPQIRRPAAFYNVSESVDRDYISLGRTSVIPILNISCENGAELTMQIPGALTPYLNNAQMTELETNADGTKTWRSEGITYVYDFTAGNYQTDSFEAAGTSISLVYGKAYEEPVKRYDIPAAVKDVFTYCTKHYGRLGFAAENEMILQQVSSMLMGGQAREGYVEWFEVVLSPLTLGDSDRGANATEVFIHEMIHQWWGAYGLNFDTADPRWSEEGMTVYSTYRLVKEKYGALYAKQYYVDEWKNAVIRQNRDFYNRHPQYLDRLPEKYRTALVMENRGTNAYMRMPLMLLKAEKLLGGEEKMDAVLRRMYADREKYDPYNGTACTYQDFLDYCGLTADQLELDESDYELEKEEAGA